MRSHNLVGNALDLARQKLREIEILRAAVIRLRTALSANTTARNGVLFLFYHDMHRCERLCFDRQLSVFQNFGDIVSMDVALRIVAQGDSGRYVGLTFDDGCHGAIANALPILASRQLPATFFVVPGWIDGNRPAVATWDQCRALSAAGMTVGSHSLSHRRLSGLDHHEALFEMAQSRLRIEAELRQSCEHFACPWGQPQDDFTVERDPALAQKAGYRSFFTTLPRRAPAHASPWMLPRVRMEPGWGDAELRYAFCR